MDACQITTDFSVTGQIGPEDMEAVAEAGFATVINNRPDGEGGPEQPTAEACRQAAEAAGLAYHYIPVTPDQLSADTVARFRDALNQSSGPVLAHCKMGPRSVILWALVQICHEGRDIDLVLSEAEAHGFEITHLRPLFQTFAEQAA